MKNKILYALVNVIFIVFLLYSCSDDQNIVQNHTFDESAEKTLNPTEKFAIALAKVLKENKEVRELIKTEALKKINFDYDVLYMLIKDKEIINHRTVESLISEYIDINDLNKIKQDYPTLTIFVPSLPNDSFSAEMWDTDKDVPSVASALNYNGFIWYVDFQENVKKLSYNEIPLFPIVVIKENERIKVNTFDLRSVNNSDVVKNDTGSEFVFIDEIFNNITQKESKTRLYENTEIPSNMQKIFDAKNIADANNVWQRDYVYYDINNLTGRGTFKRNYSEYLYSFQLVGNATERYKDLWFNDNGGDDPQYPAFIGGREHLPGWTDGEYEFKVKINISSKTGLGNELIKYFTAGGQNLFNLDVYYHPRHSVGVVRGIKSTRKYILNEPLPLFSWNLEDLSPMIKISIEEEDPGTITAQTIKTTSTFATNFEFNASIGDKEKVGAKFGETSTQTQEVALTITNTDKNDALGEVFVNFYDDVLTSSTLLNLNSGSTRYNFYYPAFNPNYNSGKFLIEITPLKSY